MLAGDVLRLKGSKVVTICKDATLLDAIRMLTEHNIGALLVTDGQGNIEGILTERDILRDCVKGHDQLHATRVEGVMTRDVIVGFPSDKLEYVMWLMTRERIRHLPIVSEGSLAGIISIGDVVKSKGHEMELDIRHLTDYITGKYPA